MMGVAEPDIGCTGRVSPLQLQVTYINVTLVTDNLNMLIAAEYYDTNGWPGET